MPFGVPPRTSPSPSRTAAAPTRAPAPCPTTPCGPRRCPTPGSPAAATPTTHPSTRTPAGSTESGAKGEPPNWFSFFQSRPSLPPQVRNQAARLRGHDRDREGGPAGEHERLRPRAGAVLLLPVATASLSLIKSNYEHVSCNRLTFQPGRLSQQRPAGPVPAPPGAGERRDPGLQAADCAQPGRPPLHGPRRVQLRLLRGPGALEEAINFWSSDFRP